MKVFAPRKEELLEMVRHVMFIQTLLVVGTTCASVLTLGAGCALAQELASAKVLSVEGQVEIRRRPSDGPRIQNIAFKVEDEVRAGDTIITGRRGRLVLGLSDGSQAVIAPQTTVVIKDLTQSPRTLFHVLRGKTRIQIEKLGGQPNPYRVNTPTAVIAVRGTLFDVVVEEGETQVFLHEGEVAVTSTALPDQPVILLAGQMTRVLWQRLPNLPSPFKAGRNDDTFKVGRQDGSSNENRRIAVGGPRPDFSRGGPPRSGGVKPDAGRGGPPSNGSRPNANPRAASKRP
jgi:hypothetical protein